MTNENLVLKALKLVWEEANAFYTQKIPGFFTPYRNAKDAALSLSAPIYAPFLLAAITAVAAVITILATFLCAATYLTAGVSYLLGKNSLVRNALDIGEFCATAAATCAILFPCCAFLTLISLPASAAHLLTRAGSSAVSGISDCCNTEESTYVIGPPA